MPEPARQHLTVLGFDYGTRRIGVAVGQTVTRTAQPLASIAVRVGRPDWSAIARLIDEWQPQRFVIGRPTHADGRRHELDAAVARFARRLEGRFGRPCAFVDEHLSSYAAAADSPGNDVDAAAARLILESWLAHT
jgi:putative Holliday junction resolvase